MNKNIAILWAILMSIPFLSQAQYWSPNGSKIYRNVNNVGIGTSDPLSKLHVRGNYALGSTYAILAEGTSGNHGTVAIKGSYQTGAGSTTSNLQFSNSNNSKYWAISSRNNWRHPNGSYEGYDLRYTFYNGSNWNTALTLEDVGQVGFGLTDPNETVHIYSNTSSRKPMVKFHYEHAHYKVHWRLGVETGSGHSPGTFMLYRQASGESTPSIPLQVNVNGQVMLGTQLRKYNTSDPAVRVNGELCVTTSGSCPDYVFADDYELMSLADLKSYLKVNKHLPGVKSAAEIEEQGGVHMVEISYSMLEKIEELTLYTLEQEERINAQSKQIQELQKSLQALIKDAN